MFSTTLLTALTVALTALGVSAGVVKRQDVATPATTLRAVTTDGKDLGVSLISIPTYAEGLTFIGISPRNAVCISKPFGEELPLWMRGAARAE